MHSSYEELISWLFCQCGLWRTPSYTGEWSDHSCSRINDLMASENRWPYSKKHSYRQLTFMPTGRYIYVQFMSLLSNTEGWGGECVPNKVGSGKLNKCAVLLSQSELVWGKLPQSAISSVRSTAIVEPTQSKSRVTNHQIILCGERVWFPSQIINHK